MDKEVLAEVEVLKHYTYQKHVMAPGLKVIEHRGTQILNELFSALNSKSGAAFLPGDFRFWFEQAPRMIDKKRVICDFIAGMTDRYAAEVYSRLTSENPTTILKPVF